MKVRSLRSILACIHLLSLVVYGEPRNEPGEAVTLSSSLKQDSLCPGELYATFTCATIGTDLTWLVGQKLMSYNANARVGTLRSSSGTTATLQRKDILQEENGYGRRLSVLIVNIRSSANEDLIVKCHNGSLAFARSISYLPKVAEPSRARLSFQRRSIRIIHGGLINLSLSWSFAGMNARDINHYRVQVDQNPPILIKNASITALIGYNWTTSSPDHDVMVVELSAIDHCGQIRGELNEQVPINSAFVSTTSQQLDMNIHQTVSPKNAAKKGVGISADLLALYLLAQIIL